MCEEVVGQQEVGELRQLEETTGDVCDLVVGTIKVCKAVCMCTVCECGCVFVCVYNYGCMVTIQKKGVDRFEQCWEKVGD